MASSNMITLKSSDGETFEVEKSVAMMSETLKDLIEVVSPCDVIPVPEVTGKILAKVIEYCKKHVDTPRSDDSWTEARDGKRVSVDLATPLRDFVFLVIDQATLFDLIHAADYLNIKSLLDYTSQILKDMVNKTSEEIRKTFNIKNDFIPEEVGVHKQLCLGLGFRLGSQNHKEGKSMASSNMTTLKSSDGETFEVEKSVAMMSKTLKDLIEVVSPCDVIPVPDVMGKILAKVIEYCKKHVDTPSSDDDLTEAVDQATPLRDVVFLVINQATLFDLIRAANYLNIKSLLDLTCQTVADMIKGKTPEEIYKTFDIKSDFTREEEEKVRRENQWAFA